jgi:hypothetical protein
VVGIHIEPNRKENDLFGKYIGGEVEGNMEYENRLLSYIYI